MQWLFLLFQRRNRLLLSTDGILLYVARRLRYVSSSVCVNRWYCRYIAVLCVKDCVKYKCRTCFSPVQCRIALRRSASYGGHPSPAPLHSAYFCKQKKSTDSKTGLPSVDLAKDGGGRTNLTYDISTLTVTKLFQV